MNKKLLGLVTGACMLPLVAHAELKSITFNLLNDAASVKHPITITGGYVSYFYQNAFGEQQPGCPNTPTSVPLVTPFKVEMSPGTPLHVTVTSDMVSCLQPNLNNLLYISLNITQVDGKVKGGDSPSCNFYQMANSDSQNPETTINIRETSDSFYCNQMQLK